MENDNKIDIESISKLSDEDLFKELKKNGLKCGPITSTTRFLYEKRLKSFIDPSSVEQEATSENTPQKGETVTSSIKVESIKIQNHESPKKTKSSQETPSESPKPSPKQSPKPAENSFRKSSPDRNVEVRSQYQESSNSSPETYLNTSGIRGRAPLRRQNSEAKVQSTTDDTEVKKGSSFTYFIIAIILSFIIYMGLIYLKDNTAHSVEI